MRMACSSVASGLEGELRGDAQAHLVGDLAAEVGGGAFQGREEGVDVAAAKPRHEGGSVAQVGAHADFGDGDARVGEVRGRETRRG